jgi:nucleotide-binding universal stress UspA family protein
MRGSIIVGVDGSREATDAARAAAALAHELGRRLVLAHVAEDPPVFPYGDRWRREVQRRHAIRHGSDLLQAVATEIGQPTARRRITLGGLLQGGVDERLAALSRAEASELLVVGSRPRGRLARALLGAPSGPRVSSSACPVLTVPPDARRRFVKEGRTPSLFMSAASRGL